MRGTRVFVSGGAGVIGRELVPLLHAEGADVMVGDLKPRPVEFPAEIRYRMGDLNRMCLAELDAFSPDLFIHLAASFERTIESPEFWDENFRHNVVLSHHLMSLASSTVSVKRVVFASSYLVYDPALYQFDVAPEAPVSLSEWSPVRPRNLTGMAKFSHEMELDFLSRTKRSDFTTLAVRIFRGYGCGSRDVISRWVRALISGDPIFVFRPEGMFDFIHAADSAEGLLRLSGLADACGVVNLGTGRSHSVAEIVDVLRSQFPSGAIEEAESNIKFEASQADTTRLRQLVDWVPTRDLADSIQGLIEFEMGRTPLTKTASPAPRNVLITSASRKAPLMLVAQDALARAAPEALVVAGDMDPTAPAQLVASDFWVMPPSEDAELDGIVSGCRARGIRAVLPTRDGELLFWARNKARLLDHGIVVIVSEPSSIERCLDKLAFAQFGVAQGLPVIPASETLDALGGASFVVKERFGAASIQIGLNLTADQALRHAQVLDTPVFQPFVEGPEISIDGWLDARGRAVGVVLRRRDLVSGGESQVSTTFRDHEIEVEASAMLERLDLRGPVVMQAVLSSDGMQVIEVNPRFGGASTLAIAAGLDTLFWSLSEAFGDKSRPSYDPIQGQVRQVRLPADITLHDPDL